MQTFGCRDTQRRRQCEETGKAVREREAWSRPVPLRPQKEPPADTLTLDLQPPQWEMTNRPQETDIRCEQGSGDTQGKQQGSENAYPESQRDSPPMPVLAWTPCPHSRSGLDEPDQAMVPSGAERPDGVAADPCPGCHVSLPPGKPVCTLTGPLPQAGFLAPPSCSHSQETVDELAPLISLTTSGLGSPRRRRGV